MTDTAMEFLKRSGIESGSFDHSISPEEAFCLLQEAFSTFNASTRRLEKSYRHLERKVRDLNVALERKNEELGRTLRETERVRSYLHNILESLNSGVVVVDSSGEIATVNGAISRLTGFDAVQVVGSRFSSLPFFDATALGMFERAMMEPGQGWSCETEIYRKEGQSFHVNMSVSPMRDTEGNVSGHVVVLQDIERLKVLEEQAERTGRVMAMGDMAVRIAHEIRNPLGSIGLFASLLRRELEGDRKRLVNHVMDGVNDLNAVLTNLLYFFGGPLDPAMVEIDVPQFFADLFGEMTGVMEKNDISLKTQFFQETSKFYGDPELLKRLFMNLLLNAVQAMPEGGHVSISTRLVEETAKILKPHHLGEGPPTQLLEVRFSDTGPGIPAEIQARAFDPFFTTRDRGAGLGLAIVHNIVEAHGGTIRILSGKDAGTTFVITLPLARRAEGGLSIVP